MKFLYKLFLLFQFIFLLSIKLVLANDSGIDLDAGQEIFSQNCSACHAGGKNVLVQERTLEKETLEKFQMYDVKAIISQVTNGKNSMPAFGDRLSEEDIQNVANYVFKQSESGW
uniref:Cytochrome c-553 n=1 Tax=Membranoptera platyphylla TaxID=1204437 RepID=A0A1I9KQF9_9FLOR|nr:cytochrome c553 [Membranoptera platyphylla]AMJ16856.1 cytochrome c553 [Membranoptera platyphylla]